VTGTAEQAGVETIEREPSRIWRDLAVGAIALLLIASVVVDHVRSFGDDWAKYDGKSVRLISAESVDTICVQPIDGDSILRVRLLGVKPLAGNGQATAQRLMQRWGGRVLRLKLDVPQTRDEQQRLLAYVFAGPSELINVQLVLDGDAEPVIIAGDAFNGELQRAAAESRKKSAKLAKKSIAGRSRAILASDRMKPVSKSEPGN